MPQDWLLWWKRAKLQVQYYMKALCRSRGVRVCICRGAAGPMQHSLPARLGKAVPHLWSLDFEACRRHCVHAQARCIDGAHVEAPHVALALHPGDRHVVAATAGWGG